MWQKPQKGKTMKTKTIVAFAIMWIALLSGCSETPQLVDPRGYDEGVNEALDCITLLSLELKLKGERKTWGEMGDIVRERLSVKPDNAGADRTEPTEN
jgi:hypothetical protein